MKPKILWASITLLLILTPAAQFASQEELTWLVFGFLMAGILYLGGQWVVAGRRSLPGLALRSLAFAAGLAIILGLFLWLLRPDLLPQRSYYDLIENRHVTERLVDPALMKLERWNILSEERQVLFVHPSSSGSTTLVYPIKIEPRTALRARLAIAPQAWEQEGDGVVYSIFVEDEAGIHLVYSQYVDPKHQEADRRWLPIEVDLKDFSGKLVRLILEVNSGPAGDQRFDWAGWGEPRLEQPWWP